MGSGVTGDKVSPWLRPFEDVDAKTNPLNWPVRKKRVTTLLYGFTTMAAGFASSVYTPAIPTLAQHFHTSETTSTLGLSLFLFGLAFGPMLWAPLSEAYGRKPSVLIPYLVGTAFTFGGAGSRNAETVLVTRFFAGFFLAAPMVNTGGVISDIWAPRDRGKAMVMYATSIVAGPVLAPLVGAAIVMNTTWKWVFLTTGILLVTALALNTMFVSESHRDVLIAREARRVKTDDAEHSSPSETKPHNVSWSELVHRHMVRPFRMLATPICFLMALYASFVYGILYLTFAALPIAFSETRGWNLVVGSLPLLAILIGVLCANAVTLASQRFYVAKMKANGGRPVPEARLLPMMIGAPVFAASLFIFGWTSDPDIHWIAPCIGCLLLGCGFFTVFQNVNGYLIDTFGPSAASALAANTVLRSIFGGAFPLFARSMFRDLGIPWASSLLGFIAVAMIPIPCVFYIFGSRIRARSGLVRAPPKPPMATSNAPQTTA